MRSHHPLRGIIPLYKGQNIDSPAREEIRTIREITILNKHRHFLDCFLKLSYGPLNRLKMMPQGVGTFPTIGQAILRTFHFLYFLSSKCTRSILCLQCIPVSSLASFLSLIVEQINSNPCADAWRAHDEKMALEAGSRVPD